jgi:hypothetical protein
MKLKRGLVLLAGAILLLAVLKESREPYLWLFVDDLIHPKPAPLALELSPGLALRLYTDTRPHTGKVARLQKGLILVVGDPGSRTNDGQERVEEGFGFGLPLIEVDGQAYLSRTAQVTRDGDTLVKVYQMDTLDTPSGFLRRKYEPVPSIGTVTVRYTAIAEGTIDVEVDLSDLTRPWDRAYLMNEQGASFFTRYEEPGTVVQGDQFGKWQPTRARRGCVVSGDGSVRFCVETDSETQRYYGRERYNQYYWVGVYVLSWAGIDLEVEAPASHFKYRIVLDRADSD